MKIQENFLEKLSVTYLLIPFSLFVVFWLKPVFSILILSVLFFVCKNMFSNNEKYFDISKKYLLATVVLCLIWCIISGIGGLYYQSLPDWNIKNALMHDLIEFNWPVTYDNGAKLVYYFGMFLPSAFIGKIIKFAGFSSECVFFISNSFSLLWALTGIVLVLLNIISYIGINKRNPIFIVLVFIFFSGMDILLPIHPEFFHIEWHPGLIQYSSLMTMMVWAYNQAIAPWLVVILFIKYYKRVENYAFWGIMCLFYAPLTFIGLSIYLIAGVIIQFFSNKNNIKEYLLKIFNIRNVLCVLILLPILYLFYKSNYTAECRKIIEVPYSIHTVQFVILECILYLVIIWKKFYKNSVFYITIFSLILIPFFRLTDCLDFSMRVSVPAIFIMAVMVIQFLYEAAVRKADLALKTILGVCLFIGACTPACEIARGVYYVFINPNQLITKDYVHTLNNKIDINKDWVMDVGDYKNYGCMNPEKSIFFKYLSR